MTTTSTNDFAHRMEQVTRQLLQDTSRWPMVTHLCVKQRGKEKCGIIMHCECGMDGSYIVVRNHEGIGAEMYGGQFKEKFKNIDSLIAAGWIAD